MPSSPPPPNSPPPKRVSPKPCKPLSAKKSPAPSPPSTAVLTPKPPTRPSWICGTRKRKTAKNAGTASAWARPLPAKKSRSPPKSTSRPTASTAPCPAHSPQTKTATFLFYTAAKSAAAKLCFSNTTKAKPSPPTTAENPTPSP